MLPTFHMNSFKPWAPPPSRKPSPPRKSPKPCSPRNKNLRRSKPCHDSFPRTLPPPRHHLPARPPAEVCVPTSADTQPCPPPHATASPNNSAPHISEPDMITRRDLQDNTGIPTDLSSPSISSSGDILEELLRLPDAQDDIPIDPVILANHGDHPHIHDGQQLRPSQHDASPGASYHRVSGHCTGAKRKARHSDEGARKRSRVPSPSGGDSFTALRSHFVSLPIDQRLQVLSWLFEGALPRCMSDFSPTVCEAGDVRETSRLSLSSSYGIKQDRHDCGEGKGSLRKSKKWSSEEVNLLLELKGDGKRPWTEVTRLFSERYPGRSPGAIQVHWSTTLSKKLE
ncbi:hypothetical protein BDV10DRAFT_194948 [Aspergillus recurvatus]